MDEIVIIVFILIIVFFMIFAVIKVQEEKSPQNQAIKEKKKKKLKEKIDSLDLNKVHCINTNILNKKTQSIVQYRVGISMKNKLLVIYKPINFSTDEYYVCKIPFYKIIGCEIIEDNETILRGGIGRAVVGGALAGGVGAIVGATTRKTTGVINSLKIVIRLSDVENPHYEIPLIDEKIERKTDKYKELYQIAHEINSMIIAIEAKNKKQDETKQTTKIKEIDVAEELRKYKKLYDEGVITSDEFNAKKKQLLGL